MDKILIKDNTKIYGNLCLIIVIPCSIIFVLFLLSFVIPFFSKISQDDILNVCCFFIIYGLSLFFLFVFHVYKLEVSETKIYVKKLLSGKKTIYFEEIISYEYKPSRRKFHVFKIKVEKKTIKILTRYYKEFNEILKAKTTKPEY